MRDARGASGVSRAPTQSDRYVSDFQSLEDRADGDGPTWLRRMRRGAMESFGSLGFPTARRGNEKWKYTSVAPIARATFEYPLDRDSQPLSLQDVRGAVPWDDDWVRLVFVDGRYSEPLSNVGDVGGGLRAASIAGAVAGDGAVARENLGRLADASQDAFTALNAAFLWDGALVELAENAVAEAALHLVFMTTSRPRPSVSHPRTLILAGPHSRLTVVESFVGPAEAYYFTNAVTEISVGEGAQVSHYRYLSESPDAFHIGATRVRLDRDSSFTSASFATGSRIARNDFEVLLDGPGASCVVDGLYSTSGNQHIDNHINIDHAKPHSSSEQYFKGILSDRSRAVFSGRVLVRKDAQKTYARQSDKNLILSDGARATTKPSLEIFADDVQCFHGATAGSVPQDALFYMRSRGLDDETARSLLVYGFASEIIDRVRLEPLRRHLEQMFSTGAPAAV